MLSFSDGIDLEWGMRAEKNAKTALMEQYRSADQIAGLVAGQCRTCNVIQFPQLEYCVNPDCNAAAPQLDQVSLVDEPAAVLTYTSAVLSYHTAPPTSVVFVPSAHAARIMLGLVD